MTNYPYNTHTSTSTKQLWRGASNILLTCAVLAAQNIAKMECFDLKKKVDVVESDDTAKHPPGPDRVPSAQPAAAVAGDFPAADGGAKVEGGEGGEEPAINIKR